MHTPNQTGAFWSDSYRNRAIATLNLTASAGWSISTHVLQYNKLFATADAAVAWMRQKIDSSAPRGAR